MHLTYLERLQWECMHPTPGSASLPFRRWRSWRSGQGESEDAGMAIACLTVGFEGDRGLQRSHGRTGRQLCRGQQPPQLVCYYAGKRRLRTSRDDHASSQIRFSRGGWWLLPSRRVLVRMISAAVLGAQYQDTVHCLTDCLSLAGFDCMITALDRDVGCVFQTYSRHG